MHRQMAWLGIQQLRMLKGHCKNDYGYGGACGWIIADIAPGTWGCLGGNASAPKYIMEM